MVRALDIRTLAGESSMFLAAYEVPLASAQAFPNSHPQKDLNYVFSMRLTPVNADKMIDLTSEGKIVKARPIALDGDAGDGEEHDGDGDDGEGEGDEEEPQKHPGDLVDINANIRESEAVSDEEYEMVDEGDEEEEEQTDSKKLVCIYLSICLSIITIH
jgi:hypothetical protein